MIMFGVVGNKWDRYSDEGATHRVPILFDRLVDNKKDVTSL